MRNARPSRHSRWLRSRDPAVRAFVLMHMFDRRDGEPMPRHRMRAVRQEIARLRRDLRAAEAAGIDVARIRANLTKTTTQILGECDEELDERVKAHYAAMQDPAVHDATARAPNATPPAKRER